MKLKGEFKNVCNNTQFFEPYILPNITLIFKTLMRELQAIL